jgi:endonuclease III-like uncharacterized protein
VSLLNNYRNEIEQIQDTKIREFVVDALSKVPEFYTNQHQLIAETQKAIEFSQVFLDTLTCSEYICDIVKSAILLQDITRYVALLDEEGDWYIEEDIMHPLNVRSTLSPLLGIVGKETFDDIMRTVEASHGVNAPIPQVIPEMTDPVFIWILPFVNQLARAYTTKN